MSNTQVVMSGNASHKRQPNGKTVTPRVEEQATQIDRWRLLDQRGQQTWHYLETDEEVKAWPQSTADRYHLGLPLVRPVYIHHAEIQRA